MVSDLKTIICTYCFCQMFDFG